MSHPSTVVMKPEYRVGLRMLAHAAEEAAKGNYQTAAIWAAKVNLPGVDAAELAKFLDTHGDFPRFP